MSSIFADRPSVSKQEREYKLILESELYDLPSVKVCSPIPIPQSHKHITTPWINQCVI